MKQRNGFVKIVTVGKVIDASVLAAATFYEPKAAIAEAKLSEGVCTRNRAL